MSVIVTSEGQKKLCQNCGRFISTDNEGNILLHNTIISNKPCITTKMLINEIRMYEKDFYLLRMRYES